MSALVVTMSTFIEDGFITTVLSARRSGQQLIGPKQTLEPLRALRLHMRRLLSLAVDGSALIEA